ncbi:MAG: putative DNA-binding domain-containing protein [Myxococcota bacterium]
MAEPLPEDWQQRMVEMIRGASDLEGSWFTGGPVCSPLDQIGIYRRQYSLRLYDALREELIGLSALMDAAPDAVPEGAEALLRRFLRERPSREWTLNRVADGLPDWLAAQDGVPVAWVEMARLDWAVQHGFEAAAGAPLDPAALSVTPKLALQPHVHLVLATHNVHEVRGAALGGGPLPALREGHFPLVVFRRGIRMRHWCVPLGLFGILEGIAAGCTLSQAIERTFANGWTTTEELTAHVGEWFQDLGSRGLVTAG